MRNYQAMEWHGGQHTALYRYGVSGEITEGLLDEIKDCIYIAEQTGDNEQIHLLSLFYDYVTEWL
jgi:hypothetical protein